MSQPIETQWLAYFAKHYVDLCERVGPEQMSDGDVIALSFARYALGQRLDVHPPADPKLGELINPAPVPVAWPPGVSSPSGSNVVKFHRFAAKR